MEANPLSPEVDDDGHLLAEKWSSLPTTAGELRASVRAAPLLRIRSLPDQGLSLKQLWRRDPLRHVWAGRYGRRSWVRSQMASNDSADPVNAASQPKRLGCLDPAFPDGREGLAGGGRRRMADGRLRVPSEAVRRAWGQFRRGHDRSLVSPVRSVADTDPRT